MGQSPTEPKRTGSKKTSIPTEVTGGKTVRRASRKPANKIEAVDPANLDDQPLDAAALSKLPLKRATSAKKAPARRVAQRAKPSVAEPAPTSSHPAPHLTNFGAAAAFIVLLRKQERLTEIDDARVTAFLTLAAAVDADPTNAQLRKEYRMAEEGLRATEDNGTDVFEELLRAMSAPVGDTTNA